mgnify:FL=1
MVVFEKENVVWGLVNIYAPNQASNRAIFWDTMAEKLPDCVTNWIVCGDFNMLEQPSDRVGGSNSTIHGRELAAWERLVFKTRILDAWNVCSFSRLNGTLLFSRSNRRNVDGQLSLRDSTNLSRIDRYYISDYFGSEGGFIGIMAGTTLSDHAPIILESRKSQPKRKAFIRIPDHLILDDSLKEEATLIWTRVMASHGTTPERVMAALQKMSRFFHGKDTLKAKEYREKEKNLRRSLRRYNASKKDIRHAPGVRTRQEVEER